MDSDTICMTAFWVDWDICVSILYKIRDGMRERFQKSINKEIGTFFVENILLHPKSRGTIRLQTTDPFDPPLIDPNYLDHPDDAKVLLKGNEKDQIKLLDNILFQVSQENLFLNYDFTNTDIRSWLFYMNYCEFSKEITMYVGVTLSLYGIFEKDSTIWCNYTGIDTMMKLANTTAFRSIGASPNDPLEEYMPPCNKLPFPSKEYWVCRMTHYTYTVYHPTSTCRIGTANDVTAVVDPQLRYTYSLAVYL